MRYTESIWIESRQCNDDVCHADKKILIILRAMIIWAFQNIEIADSRISALFGVGYEYMYTFSVM